MQLQGTKDDGSDTSLNLPFRPRARILQLLGDELIGSPRLAVFELVKNAYDADAETVRVVMKAINRRNASIIVQDDGDGMTLDVIRDIWLVPGHDHRALQRKNLSRTRRGRLPLGEKGLGRFAAHKLGDRIELVTRASDQLECVVSIDWTQLIRQQNLSDARVRVLVREPKVFLGTATGTRIVISSLRQRNWTRGQVRYLQRQITSIASPFTERTDRFETTLDVPGHEDWLTDVPDVAALLKLAPWRFWFRFDRGRFDWKYRFTGVPGIRLEQRRIERTGQNLLVLPERDVDALGVSRKGTRFRSSQEVADEATAEGIGPVTGRFYVFDRAPDVLRRLGESQLVQHYLDENGGIRVYRDGIRVYNYGESGDDWLGLDLRRVNVPARKISRNIVVGAVDLSLETSGELKEKTNREGFVENPALRRLKQIILGALTTLEAERQIDKDSIRKLTISGRDPETNRVTKPLQKLRRVASRSNAAERLAPLIDQVEHEYDELRDGMLRAGLSGMGLALVFHEVDLGVRALCNLIEAGAQREIVHTKAQELSRTLGGFNDLLRKGARKTNSLNHLIRRVVDINRIRFRKHHVRLDCPPLAENSQAVWSKFVFGLALGALNNLLDNAFYWLRVRWPGADAESTGRAIHVSINLDLAEGPAIIVADSGPGFIDDPEVLTRPFFSRRPEGMGLGLYYANLVMVLGGGRLAFLDSREAGLHEEIDGAVVALVFPEEKR